MSAVIPMSTALQVEPKLHNFSTLLGRINVMRASKLFDGFSASECEPFAALAVSRVFARGEFIFMQGDPVCRLTLILRGCITLSQTNSQGEQVIVALAGKGDALGWTDGISPHVQSCSAQSSSPCATLNWKVSSVDILAAKYPRLRLNLNQILFSRLKDLEDRFFEFITPGAERRLALSLIRLAPKVGIPESDGLRVPLSRLEMARMTGTCMFTASRILSRWTAEGTIRTIRRGIVIVNENKLGDIADHSG